MRNPEEEVQSIAKIAVQHYGDDYVRNTFCDNTLSLYVRTEDQARQPAMY